MEAKRFLGVDIMGPPRHEMVQCEVNIYFVAIFLVVDIIMGPPRHEMVQCEVNIYYVDNR